MERHVRIELKRWKESENRRPLLLTGARNVGKTRLLKDFGKEEYEYTVYLNFEDKPEYASYFSSHKTIEDVYSLLSFSKQRKLEPSDTLLILDEVHQFPEIFDFAQKLAAEGTKCHVALVTSFFGPLFIKEPFPTESVHHLPLKPLVFSEFLEATNESLYCEYQTIHTLEAIDEKLHVRLLDAFHYYLLVGGMPQCVVSYCMYQDPAKVLKIQKELLEGIRKDIHRYHGKINEKRILLVLDSIVNQLSKEHEKFQYSLIRDGARAREFEIAIEWLEQAGIILRVFNVFKEQVPVISHENQGHFKVYFLDTGLLKTMANMKNESILLSSKEDFREPLDENFVLQQLEYLEPHYYADYVREVDFILQNKDEILEIEVDCQRDVYRRGGHCFRTVCLSEKLEKGKEDIIYVPLYMAEKIQYFF